MSDADVTTRVQAFIADFHAAWLRSGRVQMPAFNPFASDPDPTFDPREWAQSQTMPDFEAWARELAALVDRHFKPGSRTGAEGGLSGKPAHDPARERIVGVEVRRTRADVATILPDGDFADHYTYRLASTADGWRIDRIVHTSGPAQDPLMPAAEVERLVAAMDPGLPDPVAEDLADGVSALFSGRYDVTELGRIETAGILTVHDLGWVPHDLAPFRRRVPGGSHRVDVARDGDGTTIALRVRLADERVTTRVPAERVGSDHVVSVDAGNVAVLDFLALTSCTEVRVEELYEEQVRAEGAVFSLSGGPPEAAVVRSGFGDGAYPAYWGLAADGTLTDLVVDFLVTVEDVTSTHDVPWRTGVVDHVDLAPLGLEVVETPDGFVFRYRTATDSTTLREVRVLGPDGEPVAGRDGGVFVQGGFAERRWSPDDVVPAGATVEVVVCHGYRHT